MQNSELDKFCMQVYTWALLQPEQKELNEAEYKKQVQRQLRRINIPFSKLKSVIHFSTAQWIEDLLEITKDVRLALQTFKQYREKMQDRARAHFGNDHKQNLSKSLHKNSSTKKVISMYKKSLTKQWNQEETNIFSDKILENTAYLVGLIKGNGVIVQKNCLVTCAHALMDENDNIMRYRCFVTGNGSFEADVGIAKIIRHFKSESYHSPLTLSVPKTLKFGSDFSPIRCLQVGLLFNNEQKDTLIKVFESAEGFIERNLYKDDKDHKLIDDMGLLVHDCYGLWGTSGSPMWTPEGELIGIHNAWNQNGYNISMIVHDDDSTSCRVVKQYQRRAIGVHVLKNLFQQWKKFKTEVSKKNIEVHKKQGYESIKKKVKLS